MRTEQLDESIRSRTVSRPTGSALHGPHATGRCALLRHVALMARQLGDHDMLFDEPLILALTDDLLETLRHKTRTFAVAQQEDPETSVHQYLLTNSPLAFPVLAPDCSSIGPLPLTDLPHSSGNKRSAF